MTDQLRQAAQQALEALENHEGNYKLTDAQWVRVENAITALNEALAQPEQKPVAYFDFQQRKFTWAKHMRIGPVPVTIKVEPMALYSTPPQRPWVKLTDDEMHQCFNVSGYREPIYQAICDKLKERNT